MSRFLLAATGLIVLACGLAITPADVRGCAIGFHAGERADVADETSLIIWDDARRTEHFIRRANFVGSAHDLAFLVPTPNRPSEIALADPELFTELARITEPKTEYRTVPKLDLGCSSEKAGPSPEPDSSIPDGVEVLEQSRVGDLDYSVLAFRADKGLKTEDVADQLLLWLNANKYVVRPGLTTWLYPYIDNTWIITAFKISGSSAPGSPPPSAGRIAIKSSTIRMSFTADRPVFPYREPVDQRDATAGSIYRLLRLFVASKQRVAGKLGEGTVAWQGKTVWSNSITSGERLSLLERARLPATTFQGRWHLTEFEDRSSPRPGVDDLYFVKSDDQAVVARTPIVITESTTPWWAWFVVILVLGGLSGGTALYLRNRPRRRDPVTQLEKVIKAEVKGPKPEDKSQKTDPRRWF